MADKEKKVDEAEAPATEQVEQAEVERVGDAAPRHQGPEAPARGRFDAHAEA